MSLDDKLENLKTKIESLKDIPWKQYQKECSSISKEIEEDVFLKVFLEEEVFVAVTGGIRNWHANYFLNECLERFSHLGDEIIKNSNVPHAVSYMLENGLYSNINLIDHVARNNSGDIQLMAARYCSVEVLREITGSKNPKLRKLIYERLGPVECLDEMLSDKKADIREMGVRMAPFGYSKLNSLTKEIARGPFSWLVKKISPEYLPMLMANRNLNNSWITKNLEKRLNLEGSKND